MTARLPTQLTTFTGAALPLPAIPQDRLLTVDVEQIPLSEGHPRCPRYPHQAAALDPERGEWVFMAAGAGLRPAHPLPHRCGAGVHALGAAGATASTPTSRRRRARTCTRPVGSAHTFYCPEDNTEDTVVIAWLEGAQVSFNDDGTFHSLNDAVLLQHLTETVAAAQGIGRVGDTCGHGANVNGS